MFLQQIFGFSNKCYWKHSSPIIIAPASNIHTPPLHFHFPHPPLHHPPEQMLSTTSGNTRIMLYPRKKQGTPSSPSRASEGKAVTLDKQGITSLFHLPIKDAAGRLDICVTSLKRVCRSLGIEKWPYVKTSKREADQAASVCGGTPCCSGGSTPLQATAPIKRDSVPQIASEHALPGGQLAPGPAPLLQQEEPSAPRRMVAEMQLAWSQPRSQASAFAEDRFRITTDLSVDPSFIADYLMHEGVI
eukprot:1327792-Rhodomonas_salina.1